MERQVSLAGPGEVVEIDMVPTSVNVQLDLDPQSEEFKHWPERCNVSDQPEQEIIIPVVRRDRDVSKFHAKIPTFGEVTGSVSRHQVEPGFSVTYHKVQGRTLSKVILDLKVRLHRPALDFFMLAICGRIKGAAQHRHPLYAGPRRGLWSAG